MSEWKDTTSQELPQSLIDNKWYGLLRGQHSVQMVDTANALYERLKEEGYLTIGNPELSSIIIMLANVWEAESFMIREGLSEHFILTIDGARTLKSRLIKDQEYEHVHGPYRKPMNRIAIKQIDAIIEHLEGSDEDNRQPTV